MRVLAQYPEMVSNFWAILFFYILIDVSLLINGASWYASSRKRSARMIVISLVLFIAALMVAYFIPDERASGHTLYDVAFDETISHEEIMAQYDVVENRGDLYIIRDLGLE